MTMTTYYPDLTPYQYEDKIYPKILNIGWLDVNHQFEIGSVQNEIVEKILLLTCGVKNINLISMKVRSFKHCPFDENVIEIDIPNTNRTRLLGISELCIPNKVNNILYCFPDMLYHYITHHQYLPPLEFLQAIEDFNLKNSYDVHNHGEFWK